MARRVRGNAKQRHNHRSIFTMLICRFVSFGGLLDIEEHHRSSVFPFGFRKRLLGYEFDGER